MPDESLLDNPIWSSLTTGHAELAIGDGLARRYPSSIGPLTGMAEPTPAAWDELAKIMPADDVAVLFLQQKPALPTGWELLKEDTLVQMICRGMAVAPAPLDPIVALGEPDFPEMIALATLAAPGPFREETGDLGGFLGIRVGGRLVAMAGERLQPMGLTEVSAVCTHPDFRGRGYAGALVAAVAEQIRHHGHTPFLTALASNTGATAVYARAGFELRRELALCVVRPSAPFGATVPPRDLPHPQ